MSQMTTMEKNATIKNLVFDNLHASDWFANAVQIGDYEFAIPVEVDGETRYCGLTLTAKSNKATKTTSAFDVDEAHEEYLESVKVKLAAKLEKEKKKAKKVNKNA